MDIGGINTLTQPLLADVSGDDMSLGDGAGLTDRISELRQQGSQLVGRPPLSSLGSSISTQQRELQTAIDQWEGASPSRTVPKSIGLALPPSGTSMQVDGKMFEAEISDLPRDQRQEAIGNLPRVLQSRVQHGFEVWQGVKDGDITGPASQEDVRDLMTFLTAKGMEKSDSFSDGAFSIEDPGNRLRDFLDSSSEVYQRPSSHISDFRDSTGGAHRGIDMDGDVHLPFGKGTVLYGALQDGVCDMKGDRLFVKMESHGCRLTASHAQNRDEAGPQDRPMRFWRDLKQTLGHAMGFFRTALRGLSGGRLFANSPDSRKERLPSDVKNDFNALVKRFEDAGDQLTSGILKLDSPTSDSRGIRTMVDNLRSALDNPALQGGDREAVQNMLDELTTRFDHLDVRIGNEMILDADELSGDSPDKAVNGQLRAVVNNLLSLDSPDDLTDDKLTKFTEQMAHMSVLLERAGDVDGVNRILRDAISGMTEGMGDSQKEKLVDMLSSEQCRDVMSAVMEQRMSLEELDIGDRATESASSASGKMFQAFMELGQALGVEEAPVAPPSDGAKTIARDVLSRIGQDSYIGMMSKVADGQEMERGGLEDERVGQKSLSEVRPRVGQDVTVVGTKAKELLNGTMDKSAVKTRLQGFLRTELDKTWSTGHRGLPQDFIRDFFRREIVVDGERFGGGGTIGLSQEQKAEKLDAFIDAVGGEDNAKKLAAVAFQNVTACIDDALMNDDAMQPFAALTMTHGGWLIGESKVEFSITTKGDGEFDVHFDLAEQRGEGVDGYELGKLGAMDFTVSGVGSEAPTLALRNFDILFSTNPPQD